jgi:3-keto-disaccharide hydrolase
MKTVALALVVSSMLIAQESGNSREVKVTALPEGFAPLFDGKSLAGWAVEGDPSWEVDAKQGVIVGKGGKGGWLRSEKEYENFVWRLEYRVAKEGGNSGMFLRATKDGNPAFTGMEIQILADAGKPPDVHSSSSLYGSVAPKKNAAKPAGQWNEVEITCKGRSVSVVMNGEKVLDVPNLDDPSIPFQEKKLSERAKKGFIGLQDHEDRVEFRNLAIKVL